MENHYIAAQRPVQNRTERTQQDQDTRRTSNVPQDTPDPILRSYAQNQTNDTTEYVEQLEDDGFEMHALHDGGSGYPRSAAEDDKLLRRDLKERHVSMIAFSACIGVGLFLQSGRVVYLAGPGLAVITYLLAGSFMWAALGCLGEMTALFPITGGVYIFICRFLDEGVGYAAGWLTWFAWVVIIASQVLAVSQLFNFRVDQSYLKELDYQDGPLDWTIGQRFSPAVWVTIFLVLILLINFLPVLLYGEFEYYFGCTKLIFIVGLIMFNLILNAMQRVPHSSRFWTWNNPYGFSSQNYTFPARADGSHKVIEGTTGAFLGMWSAMTTVIFSLIGFETVSVTAGENKDLGKTESIKMATRKIPLRIILLYALGCFTAGLNVPYTDRNLRDFTANSIKSGEHSLFILAAVRNHVDRFWPNLFNAFFIFSATTSGINSLYISSRILHSLAGCPDVWFQFWPFPQLRAKLERTQWGVPYYSVVVSWAFGLLAFLATASGPTEILGRMATNSIVSMLIVYFLLSVAYLRFHSRIDQAGRGDLRSIIPKSDEYKFRRREAKTYPYRTHFQRPRAWWGLLGCGLLAIFNGWRCFVSPFQMADFVASYLSYVVFAAISIAYHFKVQKHWQPWKWERRATMQLLEPDPTVVQNTRRRGQLRWDKSWDWKQKSRAVVDFIWDWVK